MHKLNAFQKWKILWYGRSTFFNMISFALCILYLKILQIKASIMWFFFEIFKKNYYSIFSMKYVCKILKITTERSHLKFSRYNIPRDVFTQMINGQIRLVAGSSNGWLPSRMNVSWQLKNRVLVQSLTFQRNFWDVGSTFR